MLRCPRNCIAARIGTTHGAGCSSQAPGPYIPTPLLYHQPLSGQPPYTSEQHTSPQPGIVDYSAEAVR